MTGFINGITAFFFLICVTTFPGEAQNYQHKLSDQEYGSNRPAARSFGPSVEEPSRYNQNGYDYRRFVPSYMDNTNYGSYGQPRSHNHGYNHNHDYNANYGTPRWDYGASDQYPGSQNNYFKPGFPVPSSDRPKYTTERTYPFRHPIPYTDRYPDRTTTKKTVQTTTSKSPEHLNEKNDFNISLEQTPMNRNNIKRKSDDYDPDRMVYPNETMNMKHLDPKNPSQNCTFGLCDAASDYPSEKIQRIISRSKELQQYFEGVIVIKKGPVNINIDSRFGADETICSTVQRTQFPQTAVNLDKEEQYLVNVGEYKQGIVYETCEHDGGPCMFAETFPNGYIAKCKQKYTIKRLMTAKKESENIVFDNFRLPSCCVCTVTREKT